MPVSEALHAGSLSSILAALPFAVYGLTSDLIVVYNNDRHALRDFLSEDPIGPQSSTTLLGSNLLDHVPLSEREPLGRLIEDVLRDSEPEPEVLPRGIDFLHASKAGLQRLRVLATRVDRAPSGIKVLLTCHEAAVNAPGGGQPSVGTARLDVARQLAATLNHEINNPLFVVSATLEDLLAEADDPAAQRRIRAALDSVWRVASAVKQLQEIRHVVTTAYIEGLPMVDLDASAGHAHGAPD